MTTGRRDPLHVANVLLDGKYLVEHAIGEGGAAVVYKATSQASGGPVAIKFLITLAQAEDSERARVMEEFRREARLVAELSARSSAIVQARDLGLLKRPGRSDLPFLVLEWLDGRTLDEVLVAETNSGKAPRTLADAIKLLEPIAGALAVAHERNVAHRDVKPENVFVLAHAGTGPGAQIKLLDFGIAKVMQAQAASLSHTGTLPTAFTPHYGAPEQFSRTYGETGPRTDVFAMALVLIEVMQGGRRAFRGDDYMELARQACDENQRPTPRALQHQVSDAVEAVFERALAVNPMLRYPTMAEFWSALLGAFNTRVSGFPLSGPSAAEVERRASAPPPAAAAGAGRAADSNPSRKIILGSLVVGVTMIVLAAVTVGVRRSRASGAPTASASAPAADSAASSTQVSASSVPAAAPSLCPEGALVISGGRFTMGSLATQARDDVPEHTVFVDTFCLDRTEVTVEGFKRCVSAGSCSAPSSSDAEDASKCTFEKAELQKHPVNCVSFDQAATFCAFRGMRLPTEAEFELAARRGGVVPWEAAGDEVRANLADKDGFDATAPVGSFEQGASRDGVLDLIGNVAEWQGDWFAPYTEAEVVNPKGPASGSKRVVRGGAYSGLRAVTKLAAPPLLHAAVREFAMPEARSARLGFRCAKSLR